MSVRKVTLSEWFLQYQLHYYAARYAHLPFTLDVDVTALVKQAEKQQQRFSPTAAVIKAVFIMAQRLPHLNRVLFHTPWGLRIAEPPEIRINMPVIIENNGDPVLSAMILTDVENKDVPTISTEVRQFSKSDLSDKPIGRFAHKKKNTWYNRLVLRCIHFLAHRVPSVYLKRAGAFSVTSVIRRDTPSMKLRGTGIGMTGLTVTISGLKCNPDESYTLLLGCDFNHSVLSGDEFSQACAELANILTEPDIENFYPEHL